MTDRAIACSVAGVLLGVLFAACAGPSPVAPTIHPAGTQNVVVLSQPEEGSYDLEFLWSGTRLTIVAHVRDASGAPPEGGTVALQYCSYNGYPTDDIEQPDEAPSSACDDRDAHWVTLVREPLNAAGDFTLSFGTVSVVTVIGFRLRYTGQGSGIENGTHVEDWYRPL